MKIITIGVFFIVLWTSEAAQIFCPPLERPSKGRGMEVECKFEGQLTNCFEHQHWPGTVSEYKCKPYYVSTRGNAYSHVMTCNPLGMWTGGYSYDLFICNLDCGKPATNLQQYIAGSTPTEPVHWPWQATIYHYTKRLNQIEYKCGGSLISLNVVMTAAHCVTMGNPTAILVILASSTGDYYKSGGELNAQVFQVKTIIPKENFDPSTLLSDIALLVLDRDVTLSDYVSPVCLPQEPDSNVLLSEYGSLGEVVGFGYYDSTNTKSTVLRYTQLPLQPPRACVNALDYIPSSSQLCVGFNKTDPRAVCMGDSGGGYYFKYGPNGKERYSVEGIVSFGDRTGHSRGICRNYGIFTRVLYFRQWIDEKLDIIQGGGGGDISSPKQSLSTPILPLLPTTRVTSTPRPRSQPTQTQTPRPRPQPTQTPRPTTTRRPSSTTRFTTQQPASMIVNEISTPQRLYNYYPSSLPTASPTPTPLRIIENPAYGNFMNDNNYDNLSPQVVGTDLQNLALDLHNSYRARHGADPLRLSAQLNYEAQNWANQLISSRSRLALIKNKGYGQNVYEFTITGATIEPLEVIDKALTSWYASKSLYSPSNPRHSSWTQLVWKASTELGVGLSSLNGRTVVIAFYSPPGNVKTRSGSNKFYLQNVQL